MRHLSHFARPPPPSPGSVPRTPSLPVDPKKKKKTCLPGGQEVWGWEAGAPHDHGHLVARIARLLGKQRPSLECEWWWGGGVQGLGAQVSLHPRSPAGIDRL